MNPAGPGRGHFETMELHDDLWTLSGWILHPDVESTSIALKVDGSLVEEVAPIPREVVRSVFPWIRHAHASGFRFEVPRRPGRQRIQIEALRAGRALTALRNTISDEFLDLPRPPAELMQRVSGSPDPRFFDSDSVRTYSEFCDAISRYGDWSSLARMLDWGCGCGRVSRCFLRAHPAIEVHGCDIDAEAVAWCKSNLSGGDFRAIDRQPPTGYPDNHFPLVLGYSVFSHLNARQQHEWLAEIRRIVAPGGLFLASVNGPLVTRFAFPPSGKRRRMRWWRREAVVDVLASGFLDGGEDAALRGVAPDGYYRGVYQSPEWTRREWSRHFRVLDILPGGMQNYQDLVILQKS